MIHYVILSVVYLQFRARFSGHLLERLAYFGLVGTLEYSIPTMSEETKTLEQDLQSTQAIYYFH